MIEDELYAASPDKLMDRLRRLPEDEVDVLLIGHNPGLHELAITLADTNSPRFRALSSGKFPTAARATFRVRDSWSALDRSRHEFVDYVTAESSRCDGRPRADRRRRANSLRASGMVTGPPLLRAAASRLRDNLLGGVERSLDAPDQIDDHVGCHAELAIGEMLDEHGAEQRVVRDVDPDHGDRTQARAEIVECNFATIPAAGKR